MLKHVLNQLDNLITSSTKRKLVKKKDYIFAPSPDITYIITSYSCDEDAYRKNQLPIYARGLFVLRNDDPRMVIRGYDKFFNVDETPGTTWKSLDEKTRGPYHVTLKENGCIIFVGAVNGHLLVTSKHAFGKHPDPGQTTHSQKGEEWLFKSLQKTGVTPTELAMYLDTEDITAVFELADDDFEEHILEYSLENRGLFLHGVNCNTVPFQTWEMAKVREFGLKFGFRVVESFTLHSIPDVKNFTDECKKTGSYNGKAVEGFVIRCTTKTSSSFFFKIKFDEPYLMFREWREVTKQLLRGKTSWKPRYELTKKYIKWLNSKTKTHPELFVEFTKNKGIINVRKLFLREVMETTEIGEHLVKEAGNLTEEFRKELPFIITEDEEKENRVNALEKSIESLSIKATTDAPLLIIPIAAVGCGKTTLGIYLSSIFNVQHIQSDDIPGKKNRGPKFIQAIMNKFLQNSEIVYADRNNHMKQHRASLISAFKKDYPLGKVVVLEWILDSEDMYEMKRKLEQRILKRGENHQNLTASVPKLDSIIWRFLHEREPFDTLEEKDVDRVIYLDVDSSPETNMKKICDSLEWQPPTSDLLSAAKRATEEYSVKSTVTPSKQASMVKYIGVRFEGDDSKFLLNSIKHIIKDNRQLSLQWEEYEKTNRIPFVFHVTLAINPQKYDIKDMENNEIFKFYLENPVSKLVGITCTHLVFDQDVICLRVRIDDEIRCLNKYPHITIATAHDGIRAAHSNVLLQRVFEEQDETISVITMNPEISLQGLIRPCSY